MSFSTSFHETVDRVVAALVSLGADWTLMGAVPVAAWGQARATTDADFAASLDLLDADRLDTALASRGLRKVQGPVEIPRKRIVLSKYWHASTAIGVDVFYSTGYITGDFQREALGRKKQSSFDGALGIENLLTQVVTEYKKVMGRTGPMPWEGA